MPQPSTRWALLSLIVKKRTPYNDHERIVNTRAAGNALLPLFDRMPHMKSIILPVLIFLIGCSAAFGQSAKDKVKIAADIRSVMDKQVAAWNAGDIDGFMAGYWRSPDLVF